MKILNKKTFAKGDNVGITLIRKLFALSSILLISSISLGNSLNCSTDVGISICNSMEILKKSYSVNCDTSEECIPQLQSLLNKVNSLNDNFKNNVPKHGPVDITVAREATALAKTMCRAEQYAEGKEAVRILEDLEISENELMDYLRVWVGFNSGYYIPVCHIHFL